MSKFDVTYAREQGLHPDCGDNSCRYTKNRTGMRTNGGCRCFDGSRASVTAACDHIDALEARIAKLEKMREAARRLEQEHYQLHLRLREALRDFGASEADRE